MEASHKNSNPISFFRLQPLPIHFCLLSKPSSSHVPSFSRFVPSITPPLVYSTFLLCFFSSAYKHIQFSILWKVIHIQLLLCLLSLHPFEAIYTPYSIKTALNSLDTSSWKIHQRLFNCYVIVSLQHLKIENAVCLENLSTVRSTTSITLLISSISGHF